MPENKENKKPSANGRGASASGARKKSMKKDNAKRAKSASASNPASGSSSSSSSNVNPPPRAASGIDMGAMFMADIRKELDQKADKSQVDALSTKVDGKADKSQVDDLSKKVDGKADQSAVDALQKSQKRSENFGNTLQLEALSRVRMLAYPGSSKFEEALQTNNYDSSTKFAQDVEVELPDGEMIILMDNEGIVDAALGKSAWGDHLSRTLVLESIVKNSPTTVAYGKFWFKKDEYGKPLIHPDGVEMEIAILAVNKAFPGYGSYALNTFLQKILNESWIRQGLRINAATCNPFGKDAVKFWAGQDYKPITEGGKSSRRELHKAYPLIGQNRKPPPSDVDWYYGVKA